MQADNPGYEAWIALVRDAKTREYAVMRLDNTAATELRARGRWSRDADGPTVAAWAHPRAQA